MKIKLPFIGDVTTGKDIVQATPIVQSVSIPKKVKDILLGSFLDMGQQKLSDEKSISSKLINSFFEWVYINVTTLAEEVSKLEPELYKVVLKGGEYEFVEINSHPLLDLLDRFNETTTQSDGFYLTESHLDLTGDSFWYLEGGANGAQPTNVYLLQPDKIKLVLGNVAAGASRLVAGYEYKTTIDGKQVTERYEPEEILHIKVPNPNNPYRGHSVVEGIATTLDIDSNTLEANKSFYLNGMMAQFMLTTDNKLTQDQLKKLKAEMRAAYSGSKNFWKIPIFGGGIKPQTVQMSSKDAEMLDQQRWLRDKIMAAFKNTKSSLGIVEDVNRANSESSLLNWKQSVIKPKMCRIVDALNEYLVPRYGDNLVLGFKDPVPEDMTRKVEDSKGLYEAGIITLNEAREMVDLDDTAEGDSVKQSQQPYTQDNLPKALTSINIKKILRRDSLVQKKADWHTAYDAALPVAQKIMQKQTVEIVAISKEFTNEVIWDFWEKQIAIVEVAEKRFDNMLQQYIGHIVKHGVDKLDDPEARKERHLLDREDLIREAVAKFTPILTEVVVASGNHANRLIGVDSPYIPKAMKAFDVRQRVQLQVEMFAGSMIDTDQAAMVDILVAGLEEGSSIPTIRAAITTKFEDYTKVQAERVTRTEVLRASNAGLEDAFLQSGVVEAKEWLTAGDPCPICEEYSGKIEPLGDNFYKSEEFADGNPPLHPNCRCTIIPVLVNSKAFDGSTIIKINKLEAKIDKRTKAYRDLKNEKLEQDMYIKQLEEIVGVGDERV